MQTKSSNCNKAVLHVCGSQNWLARSKNKFPAPSFLSVRALHHWGFSSLLVSSISWYVSGSIIFNIHQQFFVKNIHENPKAVLRQEHAATMRLQLEETLGTFNGFFFVTLFLNEAVQRLTFGYVTRSTSFNDVRFRLHILEPYVEGGQPPSNYFNYHTFLMPQQVCYSRNCACPLLHTQLVEYSKILTICLAETAAGNRVHTVGPVDKFGPAGYTVFQIKGSYEDQELSKYKSLRLKLHAPYTV